MINCPNGATYRSLSKNVVTLTSISTYFRLYFISVVSEKYQENMCVKRVWIAKKYYLIKIKILRKKKYFRHMVERKFNFILLKLNTSGGASLYPSHLLNIKKNIKTKRN